MRLAGGDVRTSLFLREFPYLGNVRTSLLFEGIPILPRWWNMQHNTFHQAQDSFLPKLIFCWRKCLKHFCGRSALGGQVLTKMVLDPPGDFWPSWSHWAWWETVLFAIIGMPLWLTWCLIHLSLHFFGLKKNSFQEGWWRWLFLCWCNSLVFISDDMLIQLGGVSRILFGRSQRLVSESFELRTRDKHSGFQIEELWAQNQRHVFYQTEGHFPRVGWLDFRDRMVGECWK